MGRCDLQCVALGLGAPGGAPQRRGTGEWTLGLVGTRPAKSPGVVGGSSPTSMVFRYRFGVLMGCWWLFGIGRSEFRAEKVGARVPGPLWGEQGINLWLWLLLLLLLLLQFA